jgi:hypothetical protein
MRHGVVHLSLVWGDTDKPTILKLGQGQVDRTQHTSGCTPGMAVLQRLMTPAMC